MTIQDLYRTELTPQEAIFVATVVGATSDGNAAVRMDVKLRLRLDGCPNRTGVDSEARDELLRFLDIA